jgi:fructose-1-phosphate kinase PfkB-like protein
MHPAYDVMIGPDGLVRVYFAGGPVNAALAAGLLAPHVGMYKKIRLATLYGSDNPPDYTEFHAVGVQFDGLMVPGKLRRNTLDLSKSCQAEPQLGTSELQITPGHIRTYRGFFASVQPGQVVAFTGSLPDKNLVSPLEYAQLICWVLAEKKARVIIDTRPEIMLVILDHLKAVLGEQSMEFARVVIKQNRSEFKKLVGDRVLPEDWVNQARSVLPSASLIVTCGGDGMLVVEPNDAMRMWLRSEHSPTIIKTDGCGDAQVAGTGVGLALGQSIMEAARLGMGVAQANTETLGPGRIRPERALELADRIQVEPVH